jgi:hypothetical protein
MSRDVSNMDDVIDSRDVIARIEELEALRKPWRAGLNMPGYMPDSEPASFETWEEARDYIVEEIERDADQRAECAEEGQEAEATKEHDEAIKRLNDANDEAEYGETIGQYHYWISAVDGVDAFEDASDFEELQALKALADEAEGSPDWSYGETLIRESHFEDYAQELAEDTCPFPSNSSEAKLLNSWPYRCIDWSQAARELRMDYFEVTFDGVTYLIRA